MMEPFQAKDASYLLIGKWMKTSPTLQAGITTRHGGVSPEPFASLNLGFHVPDIAENVLKNRQTLAKKLGVPLHNWVLGEQIHATNVTIVTKQDAGKGAYKHSEVIAGIDGMISREPGVLCVSMFADCVPLFFFDNNTGWLGIAHAGWKGTVNGMATKMVEALSEQGVNKNQLEVVIGPCIGQNNYEVDENVIKHIPESLFDKTVKDKGNGHYMLDLRKLNQQLLLEAGILEKNIGITNFCTFDNELFFSHRRDNGETGRFVGFIGYKD